MRLGNEANFDLCQEIVNYMLPVEELATRIKIFD